MVELQKGAKKLNTAKLQVVAVSYDSVEILARFARKQKITYPLLSDPDSTVIKAFGILNAKASGRQSGIPYPGTFVIDQKGTIRAIIPGTVRKRHTAEDLLDVAKDKLDL